MEGQKILTHMQAGGEAGMREREEETQRKQKTLKKITIRKKGKKINEEKRM